MCLLCWPDSQLGPDAGQIPSPMCAGRHWRFKKYLDIRNGTKKEISYLISEVKPRESDCETEKDRLREEERRTD